MAFPDVLCGCDLGTDVAVLVLGAAHWHNAIPLAASLWAEE